MGEASQVNTRCWPTGTQEAEETVPSESRRYFTPCGWIDTPSGRSGSPPYWSRRWRSVLRGMSLCRSMCRHWPTIISMVGPGMDAVLGVSPYPSRICPSGVLGSCSAYIIMWRQLDGGGEVGGAPAADEPGPAASADEPGPACADGPAP